MRYLQQSLPYVWPSTYGTSGHFLATNAAGALHWTTGVSEMTTNTIASNKNDYTPTSIVNTGFEPITTLYRLTADADGRTITGLTGGTASRRILLRNVGTKEIILAHQSSSSSAANRFILPYPVSFVLRGGDTYEFVYDATTARWVLIGGYDGFLKDPLYCSWFFDEFAGGSAASLTTGELGWTLTGAGTSTRAATAEQGRWGQLTFNASAGQDRCANLGGPYSVYLDSEDQLIYSAGVRLTATPADATNDYYCAFGIGDATGTALSILSTTGNNSIVCFEYDRNVSANWLYTTATRISTGNATQAASSVAVNTSWRDFGIVYKVGTSAEFFIDGTSVGTSTTDLPAAGVDDLSLGFFYWYRIAGATASWMHFDYFRLLIIRTSKRT